MLDYLFIFLMFDLLSRQTISQNFLQYTPTWLTSPYIRAGNNALFTSLSVSGHPYTFSFPFSSNLSGIPHLGYGLKAYQGNDYFGQQRFQINRTALTSSSFTVTVMLIGVTNLHMLNVPYIAIDPQFPHFINSFDNVPVNYSNGDFVNVSVRNYTHPVYYWNIINYTQQAISSSLTNYTQFSAPYQNNKILLFMTCMYMTAILQPSNIPADFNPLNLQVTGHVISNQTYILNMTLSIKVVMEKLQYSMIIFNQADVQGSLLYFLVYDKVSFTDQGGMVGVPIEFIDNFIMGFTQFSAYRTKVAMHFQWDFGYRNGAHGAIMPKSIGKSPFGTVITRVCFTVFYMKTWICPINDTFINHRTNMCQTCRIQGCTKCLSLKICDTCDINLSYIKQGVTCTRCDVDNNYYRNKTTMQCQQCDQFACPKPKIQKYLCNVIRIQVTITEYFPVSCNVDQIYIENQGISVISAQFILNNNTNNTNTTNTNTNKLISIYAQYSRIIPQSQIIYLRLGYNNLRKIPCNTIIPSIYYNQAQCITQDNLYKLMEGMLICSYILLFFSLFSGKIVGLQLFGVLQLAYYSLGSYVQLDIYIATLKILKLANGYNINNIVSNRQTTNILSILSISNTFINNINIMIILLFVLLIFVIIFYPICKYVPFNCINTNNNKILQILLILFKQGSITLIIFNLYNIVYSCGIHIRFKDVSTSGSSGINDSDIEEYITSTIFMCVVIIVCCIVVVIIQCSSQKGYGEFKNKFKQTWVCLIYIMVSILYRIIIALYSSIHSYYQYSTLIILPIVIFYFIYFIANLPFKTFYHNYRAGVIHITQLIILLVANYYRTMKGNMKLQIKSRIHQPALLVIVMIVLCVVCSAGVIFWEFYSQIKKYVGKKKKNMIAPTEGSMLEINT